MKIRLARLDDAACIAALVDSSSAVVRDDLNDDAWRFIQSANTAESFRSRLSDPAFSIYCTVSGDRMTGMISIRDQQKVDQLFVLPGYFRQGIATQLWWHASRHALKCNRSGYYWVKSSSMAVPVYKSFGFHCVGSQHTSNGITYQMMEYYLNNHE